MIPYMGNFHIVSVLIDLSNLLGSLEKENRELKTQLIAEQLQSTTKEFLPNLFPQKRETNNNISGWKLNSIVSEVIKKSQDPIEHISQREGSTKERAIAVDDIVGFTRFADEVLPQVVIDEYMTPSTGTRMKTSKGKERGDGSFFPDAPKSSISGPNQIGIQIGLGSRSQKSSSIVRQLFQSTPPPEVRPVKRPRTEESKKYRQFNPYINGSPNQALSPIIRAADPKGKFDCIIPKKSLCSEQLFNCNGFVLTRDKFRCFLPGNEITQELDVLSNQSVKYILNKYSEQWMPHTRDLETIFVPVLDDTHWYLVIATLLEHKVCWLDTNSVTGLGMSRLSDIEKLCQRIPNYGNRNIQFGQIDEDVARMNAMLTLLMSNINEEGSKIQKLAERMFANLKHRKSPSAVAN
ncbi:hypothetical protein RIF29_21019 [Crotalaria pallida]|uniref:Uncharacterized protein n=1 Tax=Crotalaria pallida TaxID=3830 RepID=A0AAN9F5Q9_CROPI